eukprot:353241-Chlamydomonas_euryale.AAC.1
MPTLSTLSTRACTTHLRQVDDAARLDALSHARVHEPEQEAALEHKPALAPAFQVLALTLQPAGLIGRPPVLDVVGARRLCGCTLAAVTGRERRQAAGRLARGLALLALQQLGEPGSKDG